MEILLENVRCLCDVGPIPLRPLTLLVGENSTGKTTFLAMLFHLSQTEFFSIRPSFNVEPFDLGTYDSIATFKGGRYGRATSFSVGYSYDDQNQTRKRILTYGSYKGQPQLSRFLSTDNGDQLTFSIDREAVKGVFTVRRGEHELKFETDVKAPIEGGAPLLYFLQSTLFEQIQALPKEQAAHYPAQWLFGLSRPFARGEMAPAFALAPVRTKPHRTYDEFSEEFRPEGDHVPVQLAHLWQEENNSTGTRLAAALADFGESSSLFKRIGVKRLGKRPSDPFQIQVTTEGPPVNLPDVGYGVSQALPLVVQSVLTIKGRRLLLQQPEVHLHPRGQAALGSFFARLVSKEKKEFVIETHSDYLVDRIRTEVAQGNLASGDILILFFEKLGLETRVHQIRLDETGNILDAPESYRQFFLDEETRLLTRASR